VVLAAGNDDCTDYKTPDTCNLGANCEWYGTECNQICTQIKDQEWPIITYQLHQDVSNWYDAEKSCNSKGGHLASLNDEEDERNIFNMISAENVPKDGAWMGMQYIDMDRGYQWTDGNCYPGNDVNMTYWANLEGDSIGKYPKAENNLEPRHHCVRKDKDGLKNDHCDLDLPYVCEYLKQEPDEILTPINVTDLAPIDGNCPPGFTGIRNHDKCFKVVQIVHGNDDFDVDKHGHTHAEALDECRKLLQPEFKPDLACINTELEQAMLTSQLDIISVGVWLGGYTDDRVQSNVMWWDGSSNDYNHPKHGEQPSWDKKWLKAITSPDPAGTWRYASKEEKLGYACQASKYLPLKDQPDPPREHCLEEFTPYSGGCYFLLDAEADWVTQEEDCIHKGKLLKPEKDVHLVSIHSEAEAAAVAVAAWKYMEDMQDIWMDVWIGLREDNATKQYMWSDGWLNLYDRWDDGQPGKSSGHTTALCAYTSTNGYWHTDLCSHVNVTKKALCKYTDADEIKPPVHEQGECPEGIDWKKWGSDCYHFSDQPKTYVAAQEDCENLAGQNSDLTSINSVAEDAMIYEEFEKKGTGNFWIGLNRKKDGVGFHWFDGSPVNYVNWAPGEPNNWEHGDKTNEECVEVFGKYGYHPKLWNDQRCDIVQHYVCKAPQGKKVKPPGTDQGTCDEGWAAYGEFCYKFEPEDIATHGIALRRCEEVGGSEATLPYIKSQYENEEILKRMQSTDDSPLDKRSNYWIGLHKEGPSTQGNTFDWIKRSPGIPEFIQDKSYDNWASILGAPLEDDDAKSTKDCVAAIIYDKESPENAGKWIDVPCASNNILGVVCQKPITKPDTGLSDGEIAGVVISVLVLLVLVIGALLYMLDSKGIIDIRRNMDDTKKMFDKEGDPSSGDI